MLEVLLYLFAFIGMGTSSYHFVAWMTRVEYYFKHAQYPVTKADLAIKSSALELDASKALAVSLEARNSQLQHEYKELENRLVKLLEIALKEE